MDPTISEALAAVRRGEVDAYAVIVRAYDDELRGFLLRRCADRGAVDELWQDAFVAAFRRLARYDAARAPFGAWLKGVATNLLRQRGRKRARDRRADPLALAALDDGADLGDADDSAALAALRACLAKLPDDRRALVAARYREGRPVAAVAAALGRTETWVTTTLQRLRRALRACIDDALRQGA